jgi:aldose 1-epimerase
MAEAVIDRLTIMAGEGQCAIGVEGGLIHAWRIGGQDMLRPSDGSDDPLASACFPLAPYTNRIAAGRFDWNGRTVTLPPSAPEAHALHGVGWRRRWAITPVAENSAAMRYEHAGDGDWPWPFLAEQTITISPEGLTVALSATNLADEAVPLVFALHPYFDGACARLRFATDAVWITSPDLIPLRLAKPFGQYQFAHGGEIAGRSIDSCYEGWDGEAQMRWAGRPRGLRVTASENMRQIQLFIPKSGEIFCLEPVPHMPDALNRGAPMPVIAPGKAFRATISFEAI